MRRLLPTPLIDYINLLVIKAENSDLHSLQKFRYVKNHILTNVNINENIVNLSIELTVLKFKLINK